MSYEVQQYGGVPSRPARRAARAISQHRMSTAVQVSGIDAVTDVAMAKEDAYTAATGTAMGAVVRVAQAQRHLETLVPEASGRLAMLADDHALAMSELLTDYRRQLRRY